MLSATLRVTRVVREPRVSGSKRKLLFRKFKSAYANIKMMESVVRCDLARTSRGMFVKVAGRSCR